MLALAFLFCHENDLGWKDELVRRSALLQRFLQRLAGVLDVLAQEFAGAGDVALAAKLENLVVLLVGARNSVR